MFVAWFTYDVERPPEDVTAMLGDPGHRWITALGPIDGNRALLEIVRTEGGVFDASEPAPMSRIEGTIELVFDTCLEGVAHYDLPDLELSGSIPTSIMSAPFLAASKDVATEKPGVE